MPQKQTRRTRQQGDGNGDARAFRGPSSRRDRLEAAIEAIQQTLDIQFKRIAAMQAEIDLMRAKRRS